MDSPTSSMSRSDSGSELSTRPTTAPSSPIFAAKSDVGLPSPFYPPSLAQLEGYPVAAAVPSLPEYYPSVPLSIRADDLRETDAQTKGTPDEWCIRDSKLVRLTGELPNRCKLNPNEELTAVREYREVAIQLGGASARSVAVRFPHPDEALLRAQPRSRASSHARRSCELDDRDQRSRRQSMHPLARRPHRSLQFSNRHSSCHLGLRRKSQEGTECRKEIARVQLGSRRIIDGAIYRSLPRRRSRICSASQRWSDRSRRIQTSRTRRVRGS